MHVVDGVAYSDGPAENLGIRDCKYVGNHTMLFKFTTGETRLFDAKPLLGLEAFRPLADEAVFSHPVIDHGVPTWCDGEINLSPAEIYSLAFNSERTI